MQITCIKKDREHYSATPAAPTPAFCLANVIGVFSPDGGYGVSCGARDRNVSGQVRPKITDFSRSAKQLP